MFGFAKSCNPIEYVWIDRLRDPAEWEHPAVRAAEGHGRRRRPERVVPALQGHGACRPAAPVPGRTATTRSSTRCCRRWIQVPRGGVRLRGRAPGGDDAERGVRGEDHVEPHRRPVGAARRPVARGRVRAAALRAGDPARQGRPGGVAVDRDPDAGVAGRGHDGHGASRSIRPPRSSHLVDVALARRARLDGVAGAARPGRRRLRGLRPRPVADDRGADRRAGAAGAAQAPGGRALVGVDRALPRGTAEAA